MTGPFTTVHGVQVIDPQQLTSRQRLERWALALEKLGDAPLRTLRGTEHLPPHERSLMREDNSPIAVAFEEPILRSAGLQDDTYGEARHFFGVSDWDLHYILCDCHFGASVRASEVAARVRSVELWPTSSKYAALYPILCAAAVTFVAGLLVNFSG